MRTDIVMLATGEYSNYATTPYKVMKPFTMQGAFAEFSASFDPKAKGRDFWCRDNDPAPEEFQAWLVTAGYLEELNVHEVHIGSYARAEFKRNYDSILTVPFAPEVTA